MLANLQRATEEVFDLMLASPLATYPDSPPAGALDVASMVGLTGAFPAVLTMRCSSRSAARMALLMLGIDSENAGQAMWDAVGEISNMVAGNFKHLVDGLEQGCFLSIPTVITGADYRMQAMASDDLHLAFLFEGEPIVFSLEVYQ